MTNIEQLQIALQESWSSETSYEGMATPDNLARGHCVVSSLVVQDYLGGDLFRDQSLGDGINERHYYNVLDDGTIIDTTRGQYQNIAVSLTPAPVDLKGEYGSIRQKLLSDSDTKQRCELLSKRVRTLLKTD